MSELKKCMIPNCGEKMMWKGLCNRCYGQAKYYIERGETTWSQLAAMGLCVTNSVPFKNAFEKAYAKCKVVPYDPKIHKGFDYSRLPLTKRKKKK